MLIWCRHCLDFFFLIIFLPIHEMYQSPGRPRFFRGRGWARNRSKDAQTSSKLLVSTSESSDPRLLSYMWSPFINSSFFDERYWTEENTFRGKFVPAWMIEPRSWTCVVDTGLQLRKKLFWNVQVSITHKRVSKSQSVSESYLVNWHILHCTHYSYIICRKGPVVERYQDF